MREWERLTAAENPALAKFSFGDDAEARSLAEKLTEAEILEVVELREGLSVRSTSYVGRIQLGNVQITIQPKLDLTVLLTLFGYAYKLPDLHLMTKSELDAEPDAFQDILIHQLIFELTKLLSRGLHRQYRMAEGSLAVTKGRIDFQRIARHTSVHGTDIPVIHHPKLEDNLINQVLLAGIRLAFSLTTDANIRSRLRRLAGQIEGVISPINLDFGVMQRLSREMNRLTAHYEPSIALIELLMSTAGITLEANIQQAALPGFLFDMNRFFERLLSRFLKENLPAYTVHDQQRLKGMMAYSPGHNPKRRRSPTPRPDFVITDGERLVGILDAKYRDLWDQSLPRDMLYQLAVYALSQGWNGQSIILYPCVTSRPVPQVIEINEAFANSNKARVILTPVNLNYLSELLQDSSISSRTKRAAYAEHLLLGSIHISR
jgi:5-methylcytosine-specific restriction enzyme subunit McrC